MLTSVINRSSIFHCNGKIYPSQGRNVGIYKSFHLRLHSLIFLLNLLCVCGCVEVVLVFWLTRTTLLAQCLGDIPGAPIAKCVFWLVLLSMDGMSARGREKRETDRQTNREREREAGRAE